MHIEPLLAAAVFLLNWWQALAILIPFVPWAWLVSSKLDKDARYFHLNQPMWNSIHLAAGFGALVAMFFIPIFWVSWPVGVLILVTPVLVYWQVRNRAVPEDKQFHLTSEGIKERLAAARQGRADRAAVVQFVDGSGKERAAPQKEDPLHSIHMLAEDLITPALAARASRVEVAVGQSGGVVAQTVDGVKYKRETIPTDAAMRLVDYLKDIAGMEVDDRRRKQTGECKMNSPGGSTTLSLTTSGSSSGHVMRIEFNRESRLSMPFDSLGLLPQQLEALRETEAMHARHGLILIGAPPGHGLSTSVYSFVNRHDAYTSNIKTLERDIIVVLDGVDQIDWDPSDPDADYATNLQSILRRDPDIVMTGLIRDTETARVVATPGLEGPLIYVPQRAGSVIEQIREWVKQVGDVKRATGVLLAVTNQRLLRRLCPKCRQAFQPSADQLKKLGLPPDRVKQLYRASGKVQVKNKIETCPVCGGSGYLGQVGVFEVLRVDDAVRKILMSGDLKAALQHARRNKMIYMQEAALSKVIAGETTIEEVRRVLAGERSGDPSAARPQPNPAA